MDALSRILILLNPRTYNCGGMDLGAAWAIQLLRHDGLIFCGYLRRGLAYGRRGDNE
jgi:hypothetical protein